MSSNNITQVFRDELKSLLLKSEFNNYLTFKQTDEYSYNNKILTCQISGRIPKNLENDFLEFKENLFELAEKNFGENAFEKMEKILDVQMGISLGEILPQLDCFDLLGNKYALKVSEFSGKVLAIDLWATWCKFCQAPMEENIQIARKFMGESVESSGSNDVNISALKDCKIIGLSLDENENKWKEHIKEKSWDCIMHLNKPNVLKVLNIVGIPQIILVGKDSKIKYLGAPKNIELKETLENLSLNKDSIIFKKENFDEDLQLNSLWNKDFTEEKKQNAINEIQEFLYEKGSKKVDVIIYSKSQMEKNGEMKSRTIAYMQGEGLAYEEENFKECKRILNEKYMIGNIEEKITIAAIGMDEDF